MNFTCNFDISRIIPCSRRVVALNLKPATILKITQMAKKCVCTWASKNESVRNLDVGFTSEIARLDVVPHFVMKSNVKKGNESS